jgi:hypothetical protein
MKKIILLILFLYSGELLGQSQNLSSPIAVYGQLVGNNNYGNLTIGFSSTNVSSFQSGGASAPDGEGIVYSGVLVAAPPAQIFQNGNGVGGISTSDNYPFSSSAIILPFHGAYTTFSLFKARFAYRMVAPNPIALQPAASAQSICANKKVLIYSLYNWPLFSDDFVATKVIWEYNIKNSSVWSLLDSSSRSFELNFIPALKIAESKTTTVTVRFRCRIQARYPTAVYYSDYGYSANSTTDYLTFAPAPPVVDTTKIIRVPSCYGLQNGEVHVPASAITAGFSTLSWILRKGTVSDPCVPNPGTGGSNCGDIEDWKYGVPSNQDIDINSIASGNYTLWIFNPGADAGNCITPIPIWIPQLTDLTITKNQAQSSDVTCYGSADGKIGVTAVGGNGVAAGYFFTLTDGNNVIIRPEQRATGTTMQWTGLAANTYKVLVKDGTCSKVVTLSPVSVLAPDQITGVFDIVHPTCSATANGSIKVTAVGTATTYYFTLYKDAVLLRSSGATTATNYTFSGLAAGNYYVTMPKPGCTAWTSSTMVLNAVTPLALQLVTTDSVSCNGGSDGTLKVSDTGGAGSYQYTLGAVTNTTGQFTGLSAGSYNVTVKNQGGTCSDAGSGTFSVPQRKLITVSLQKTDITCNGTGNGMLKAIVNDGSGSYLYTWQQLIGGVWTGNSFWFSTDTKIEGLGAGSYRVIITDNKSTGCTVTSDVVTLAEPPVIAITSFTVNEAVCLAEGASVNMTASGGDGNYTYKWSTDGGTTYSGFTTGNALHAAGTYTFAVFDGKGCKVVAQANYEITLPDAALSFTTTLSNISCTGNADGSVEVTAAGGSHTYQYQLDNAAYQSGNKFNNLTAGSYTVSVKDSRGCVQSTSIILTEPAIKINAVKTDILCYDVSSGSIVTNISGGAAPYTCLVNNQPAGTTISNLPAGDYTLHITDANGCSKDTVISIVHLYQALHIEAATVSDIVCYGTTGSIALATTGGDGDYQYRISDDNWTTSTSYTSAGELSAGNYNLRVTDGQGCSATYADHLLITSPAAALTFTTTLSDYNGYNISCSGGDNGFAKVVATGGSGVYKYSLDSGTYGDSSFVSHINAGTHLISVKDTRGCISSHSYAFTQSSAALDIVLVNKADVICAATPAGNITVAGTGGVGALQYSIDNTTWQSATSFYNLVAGNYTIMVKDVNSCSIGLPVQINSQDPAVVIDKVTLTDIVCYDGKGFINVQAHGGTGVLGSEYSLNGGAYTTFNSTMPLGVGAYKVRVKDAPGCYSAVVDAGSITSPAAALTAIVTTSDFNGKQISCNGLSDGTVTVAVAGGGSAYQYSFNNEVYGNISSYDHLTAGTYALKIKDNRGCVITENVLMQESAPLSISVAGIEDLSCGADPSGKISLQAAGGLTSYQYDLGDGKWQNTPVFSSLMDGSYNVRVKDINGCIAVNNAIVKALNPAISAVADITPVNCYGESNGAVKVKVSGGDGSYTYQWNVAGINPQQLKAGNYTLKVTDGKGCFRSYSYEVQQPDQLTLAATAPAVCDGLSDGRITAVVEGGITPYQYALDQGSWGVVPVFENITAGNYKVMVQDANGCIVNKELVIDKANIKPDVNFLVASRKNALDTLVIKEISLPAPDKVSWTYSPEAIQLGDGLIRFSQPGNYWVQMTATFGSCTYSLKKDLVIGDYDPLAGPVYSQPVHVIDTLILSPNPNNGNFSFQVKMIKKQQVVVNVYDMNGRLVDTKQYSPSLLINDTFSLGSSISGTYLLRVIAENDSRDIRFIISR